MERLISSPSAQQRARQALSGPDKAIDLWDRSIEGFDVPEGNPSECNLGTKPKLFLTMVGDQ